jgi:hypothetical protein
VLLRSIFGEQRAKHIAQYGQCSIPPHLVDNSKRPHSMIEISQQLIGHDKFTTSKRQRYSNLEDEIIDISD